MEHKAPATALAPLSLRYAVLGLALLLGGCRETAAPPPPPVPTVDVLTVAPRDVPIHREWVGTLDGEINATIRPQVTGYLVKQNYRETITEMAARQNILSALDIDSTRTLTDADIDWLIPHQANIRIMQGTARKLKMSMDKVVVTVDQHGNTSAASIPLALDHAVRAGQVKKGETLLLEGVGGGFTWGAVLLKL